MTKDINFYIETADLLGILEPSIAQGLAVDTLLESLSLPNDLLSLSGQRISLAEGWRIIAAHQQVIQEETHLMSTRPLKRGTTRFVFSNLIHCKTLLEGLELLADTYNIVHGGNYNFVKQRDNCLSYVVEDSEFHYRDQGSTFAIEFALIMIHCAITYMAGHRVNLASVRTKRPRIEHQNHHLNAISGQVEFDHAHYELVYELSAKDTRLRTVEDIDLSVALLDYFMALEDTPDNGAVAATLLERVSQQLQRGLQSQQDVAAALNMSVATLRRKLGLVDTNFRAVRDQVNSELAAAALIEQRSVVDVAEQLGYCDVRSFKRAFKRWRGVSPAVFLKKSENDPLR